MLFGIGEGYAPLRQHKNGTVEMLRMTSVDRRQPSVAKIRRIHVEMLWPVTNGGK